MSLPRRGADLSFTLNALDVDGDTLVYSIDNLPGGASVDSASGNFFWPASSVLVGEYNLVLKASDSELTAMRDLFIEVYWVLIDEDGDTVDDYLEIEKGMDPTTIDSDGDGIDDGTEYGPNDEL